MKQGHLIYCMNGGKLQVFRRSGDEHVIELPKWKDYDDLEGWSRVKWWKTNFDITNVSGKLVLTEHGGV